MLGSAVLTQNILLSLANVSGVFVGSHLNFTILTEEDNAIYMSVKKMSFYLLD